MSFLEVKPSVWGFPLEGGPQEFFHSQSSPLSKLQKFVTVTILCSYSRWLQQILLKVNRSQLWFSLSSCLPSLPYDLGFLMELIVFLNLCGFLFLILRTGATITKLFICQNGNSKLGMLFKSFALPLSCVFLLKIGIVPWPCIAWVTQLSVVFSSLLLV